MSDWAKDCAERAVSNFRAGIRRTGELTGEGIEAAILAGVREALAKAADVGQHARECGLPVGDAIRALGAESPARAPFEFAPRVCRHCGQLVAEGRETHLECETSS